MNRDQFEINPVSGLYEKVMVEDRKVGIYREQDVSFYRTFCHENRQAKNEHGMFRKSDGMYHAATIPTIEIEYWKSVHGFDWFEADAMEQKAMLNSEHCAEWRTQRSKV